MKKTRNRVVAFVTGLLFSGTLVLAGLETGTYISDLVVTNPTSSDLASTADDHMRLIKSTVKTTFPNVSGAVTPTHTELNYVDGVTSAIQTQIDAKVASSSFPNVSGTVNPTHTELNFVDGVTSAIQTQLDAKLASASYTAADVLTKIKTVDGAASGLDADLLDGQSSSAYAAASTGTYTGTWTGCTTSPTQTIKYRVANEIVSLYIPTQTCTSNSTNFSITGGPSAVQVTTAKSVYIGQLLDNSGGGITGCAVMSSSGTLDIYKSCSSGAWTSSGLKGIGANASGGGISLTYSTD